MKLFVLANSVWHSYDYLNSRNTNPMRVDKYLFLNREDAENKADNALKTAQDTAESLSDYAKKSDAKEFIIGTENSIVQHLQFECPDKKFYPLSKDCVCHNMKLTTLADVYQCVLGTGGEEILLEDEIREKAGRCINTMLELGQ